MGRIRKGVHKTKSSPTSTERKIRLIGRIRAKAADMAKKSAEAHHQAQKKIYALRSHRI